MQASPSLLRAPRCFRLLALCAAPILLSGCFGGGGVADALTDGLFSSVQGIDAPSSVSCNADPLQYCYTEFTAYPNRRYVDFNFNWQDQGAQKVIADFEKVKQADNSWRMTLTFKRDLPPGQYQGRIKLDIRSIPIGDPFTTINSSYIDYTLTVGAYGAQFKTGAEIGRDWGSTGGSAAHDGFFDVKLDPSQFSRRFSWRAPDDTSLENAVTGGGKLMLATRSTLAQNPAPPMLLMLDEARGAPQWQGVFQSGTQIGQMASDDKRVYLLAGEARKNAMHAFNLDGSGMAYVRENEISSLAPALNPGAPVLQNGLLCAGDGAENEIQCRNSADGSLRYKLEVREKLAARFWGFSPAMTADAVLANLGGRLFAWRSSDGALLWQIDVPGVRNGTYRDQYETAQAPLISGHVAVLRDKANFDDKAVDNQLSAVDLSARKLLWTSEAGQFAAPVAGNGLVYALNRKSGKIEARNLADGKTVWSLALPQTSNWAFYDEPGSDLILTQNLLFASSGTQTVAIDLSKREIVWRYSAGGRLLLSRQGVLYILRRQNSKPAAWDGVIGINLR
ncbi:PQQ-binding-like beta-propeller repeat protein [Massilia sp. W12]|uniref:outer membrane protein assembly factor BamB family protein n=1 Tax=Massilia sp. W12 TaxID=3126507 RepID=UPI0030D233F1